MLRIFLGVEPGLPFSKTFTALYGGALNSGGATGYGVRLLNKLIEDNYE